MERSASAAGSKHCARGQVDTEKLYDCFREGVLWTGESQIFVELLYSLAVSVTVHIMTADGMV